MTTAQILATARIQMLRHHGPQCAQRPLWEQLGRLLGEAEDHATALAEANGVDTVDEQLIRPLAIANAYLDLPAYEHAKEHTHAGS